MQLGSAKVNTNIAIFEYETNAVCMFTNEVDTAHEVNTM